MTNSYMILLYNFKTCQDFKSLGNLIFKIILLCACRALQVHLTLEEIIDINALGPLYISVQAQNHKCFYHEKLDTWTYYHKFYFLYLPHHTSFQISAIAFNTIFFTLRLEGFWIFHWITRVIPHFSRKLKYIFQIRPWNNFWGPSK